MMPKGRNSGIRFMAELGTVKIVKRIEVREIREVVFSVP